MRPACGWQRPIPARPAPRFWRTWPTTTRVYSEWAPNEKVALDVAIGAAYAGSRAMAVMKHVGLNVAADAFFYVSMTGTEAGLVVVCADDPDMYSSQNEQDNRHYCKFARVPCLEPSDSQEAKDMVGVALDISEQFDTPVMLRLTTRISHSDTLVELGERTAEEPTEAPRLSHRPRQVRHGARATPGGATRSSRSAWPDRRVCRDLCLQPGRDGRHPPGHRHQWRGLPVRQEVFPDASFLKLGMTYPLPGAHDPRVCGPGGPADRRRRAGPLHRGGDPPDGHCRSRARASFRSAASSTRPSCASARSAAGLLPEPAASRTSSASAWQDSPPLPARPPLLCPGCPHRGVFVVTNKLKLVVNGDIGCYTLGFLPPLSALHTCGCMGASIGVAHGVSKAGIAQKNVAVIGDSTFFHTGMPALLNVAYNQSDTVVIILDNRTTAMTGHQEHPGTGKTLMGQPTHAVDFEELARAMGYRARAHRGPVRPRAGRRRRCATAWRPMGRRWSSRGASVPCCPRPAAVEAAGRGRGALQRLRAVLPGRLPGHRPRATRSTSKTGRAKAGIDPLLCTGCEICAQVCVRKAIPAREQDDRGGEGVMSNDQLFWWPASAGRGRCWRATWWPRSACEAGFDVKKAEVHGMAQRGGSVNSHVRWGTKDLFAADRPGRGGLPGGPGKARGAALPRYAPPRRDGPGGRDAHSAAVGQLGQRRLSRRRASTPHGWRADGQAAPGPQHAAWPSEAGNARAHNVVVLGALSTQIDRRSGGHVAASDRPLGATALRRGESERL